MRILNSVKSTLFIALSFLVVTACQKDVAEISEFSKLDEDECITIKTHVPFSHDSLFSRSLPFLLRSSNPIYIPFRRV